MHTFQIQISLGRHRRQHTDCSSGLRHDWKKGLFWSRLHLYFLSLDTCSFTINIYRLNRVRNFQNVPPSIFFFSLLVRVQSARQDHFGETMVKDCSALRSPDNSERHFGSRPFVHAVPDSSGTVSDRIHLFHARTTQLRSTRNGRWHFARAERKNYTLFYWIPGKSFAWFGLFFKQPYKGGANNFVTTGTYTISDVIYWRPRKSF